MKNLKNQKGQALVEFALILPILLLLVMGIFQFGMMINAYLAIENASREGARVGIIGSTDTEIVNVIRTTSPGLDPNKLVVTITPTNRVSGDTLTVAITYNYELIVPIISSLLNNEVTLNSQTSMRVE